MRWKSFIAAGLALTIVFVGCSTLDSLLGGPVIRIRVFNNGGNQIQAKVAYSPDPNISRDNLIANGFEVSGNVAPGSTIELFRRTCPEIKAVMMETATVFVNGNAGPSTQSTEVFRDPTNFQCQQSVRFTVAYSPLLLDVNVQANQE